MNNLIASELYWEAREEAFAAMSVLRTKAIIPEMISNESIATRPPEAVHKSGKEELFKFIIVIT